MNYCSPLAKGRVILFRTGNTWLCSVCSIRNYATGKRNLIELNVSVLSESFVSLFKTNVPRVLILPFGVVSKPMRSILTIEYGYVRVYINSVALQAVVEHGDGDGDGPAMPVFAMLNPSECNKEYFGEVIAAAKSILHTVVEDLLPDNQLMHIPIRTYSRILAGAMFCLKVSSFLEVLKVESPYWCYFFSFSNPISLKDFLFRQSL